MMSEEIVVKTEGASVRSLEVIGSEIETIKSSARAMISAAVTYTNQSFLEIGKRLLEAKNSVEHGKYLPWLKTVGYNERTARQLIQIYTEMGKDEAFASLTYAQMRELLPFSSEQRKDILSDVEDKSSREIKRLVGELKAAEKAREEAEAAREAAEADRDAIEVLKKDAETLLEQREKDLEREKKLTADYFAAKTTAEADLKKLKKDHKDKMHTSASLLLDAQATEKELRARIADLEKQVKTREKRDLTEAEMNAIRKQAEKELAAKQAKAEALSDPLMVELNVQLKQLQYTVMRLSELLGDMKPDVQKDMVVKVSKLVRLCLYENGLCKEE